jgi:peroxiredoxin
MLARALFAGLIALACISAPALGGAPVFAQAKGGAVPGKPAPAPVLSQTKDGAALGKPAPDFTLTDTDGKTVTLSKLRGKTVVLEWFNPDCPFIKYAHSEGPLKTFPKRVSNDKLVWLTINSSAAGKQGAGLQRNRQAKAEYGIDNTLLLDESGIVGRTYGAEKTPHMFVIDPNGVLVYRGGLDNAPVGKVDNDRPRLPETKAGTLEPYVEVALADMAKKRALRLADTPAYGCGVKYAD